MITLVMGGQFGSEGKGSVVSWIAEQADFDLVIRTGGANSGHTFKRNSEIFKMRQLPCTWAFQDAPIYIPAGAVINLSVFENEVRMVRQNGYQGEIFVSPQASIIEPEAFKTEQMITSGTTGEGLGATRANKCLRRARLARDVKELQPYLNLFKPDHLLTDRDSQILIESPQGFGLSLDGKYYPYVTSININPYHILDDAEVPFGLHKVNVWLVVRTYPIRIAGNSGALYNEISWSILQQRHGKHIPTEQTTVTKKTRRVGEWNTSLVKEAIRRCHPDVLVLTFIDYIFPDIAKTGMTREINHYLLHIEAGLDKKVDYFGIGIGEIIPREILRE